MEALLVGPVLSAPDSVGPAVPSHPPGLQVWDAPSRPLHPQSPSEILEQVALSLGADVPRTPEVP